MDFIKSSEYFGLFLVIICFKIGQILQIKLREKNKTLGIILNPLLTTSFIIILILKSFNISYDEFNSSAKYIYYLLTPTTVCFAIPLYKNFDKIKKNCLAILIRYIFRMYHKYNINYIFS